MFVTKNQIHKNTLIVFSVIIALLLLLTLYYIIYVENYIDPLFVHKNGKQMKLRELSDTKWDEAIIVNRGYGIESKIQEPLYEFMQSKHMWFTPGSSITSTYIIYYLDNNIVDVYSYDYKITKTIFTTDSGKFQDYLYIQYGLDLFESTCVGGYMYYVLSPPTKDMEGDSLS